MIWVFSYREHSVVCSYGVDWWRLKYAFILKNSSNFRVLDIAAFNGLVKEHERRRNINTYISSHLCENGGLLGFVLFSQLCKYRIWMSALDISGRLLFILPLLG